MEGSDISILVILGLIGFIWLLLILIIISSGKTTGSEKLAWVLAVIFMSRFAWIFYLLLAPIKKRTEILITNTPNLHYPHLNGKIHV